MTNNKPLPGPCSTLLLSEPIKPSVSAAGVGRLHLRPVYTTQGFFFLLRHTFPFLSSGNRYVRNRDEGLAFTPVGSSSLPASPSISLQFWALPGPKFPSPRFALFRRRYRLPVPCRSTEGRASSQIVNIPHSSAAPRLVHHIASTRPLQRPRKERLAAKEDSRHWLASK